MLLPLTEGRGLTRRGLELTACGREKHRVENASPALFLFFGLELQAAHKTMASLVGGPPCPHPQAHRPYPRPLAPPSTLIIGVLAAGVGSGGVLWHGFVVVGACARGALKGLPLLSLFVLLWLFRRWPVATACCPPCVGSKLGTLAPFPLLLPLCIQTKLLLSRVLLSLSGDCCSVCAGFVMPPAHFFLASCQTIHSFAGDFRAFKALIAAQYAGVALTTAEVDVAAGEHKTPAFLAKNPLGKVRGA